MRHLSTSEYQELTANPAAPAGGFVKVFAKGSRFYAEDSSGNVHPVSATNPNSQAGSSYTLALTDAFRLVEFTGTGAATLTIPLNSSVAFPLGTIIQAAKLGSGNFTVSTAATLRDPTSRASSSQRYEVLTLIKRDTDEWLLFGDGATKSVGHTFGGGSPGTPGTDEITIFTLYDILYYIDDSGVSRPVSAESIRTESSASYTLALPDSGYTLLLSGGFADVTVPTNATVAFPIGTEINLVSTSGFPTVTAAGGVTFIDPSLRATHSVQGSMIRLIKTATDTWLLDGDGAHVAPYLRFKDQSPAPTFSSPTNLGLYTENIPSSGSKLMARDTFTGFRYPVGHVFTNTQTGSTYTLDAGDVFRDIEFTNEGGCVVTIPTNASVSAFFQGSSTRLINRSRTCCVRIVPASGVTWDTPYQDDELGPGEDCTLHKYTTNGWLIRRPMSRGLAKMWANAPTYPGA